RKTSTSIRAATRRVLESPIYTLFYEEPLMGRVGAAGDNAAMESFFPLLQKNVVDRRRWSSRDQLRIAIVTWIERTYHRRRRQARLDRLTPVEYEAIIESPAVAA